MMIPFPVATSIRSILIGLLGMVALSSLICAGESAASWGTVTHLTAVWSQPDFKSPKTGQINAETNVLVLNTDNKQWTEILAGGGAKGWIPSRFLKIQAGEPPAELKALMGTLPRTSEVAKEAQAKAEDARGAAQKQAQKGEEAVKQQMTQTVGLPQAETAPSPRSEITDARDLQEAVKEMAIRFAERYKPMQTDMLSRLAVLDFDVDGEEAKKKDLGKTTANLLAARLVSDHGIRLIERSRIEELKREVIQNQSTDFDQATTTKIGGFLGAQALVLGSIAEAGADYIITARLVEVRTGVVLVAVDVRLQREGMIALADEAVEKKSRAGAIYRSLIPGWGQFYNGREHYAKGYTISSVCLASLATGVTMYVLAAEKMKTTSDWDVGSKNYLKYCNLNTKRCQDEIKDIRSQSRLYNYVAIGAISTFGLFYLWGIVDAAIYGRDYERVRLSVAPVPDRMGRWRAGVVGLVTFGW